MMNPSLLCRGFLPKAIHSYAMPPKDDQVSPTLSPMITADVDFLDFLTDR
ncbi:hypothetical protein SAMN04487950_4114 [Halogranum rubrum]|uniref:Uncharacterized protein n=1 Tax=Halogranum rubrum TaxID=553466 RepID=A0A1I4IHG0_9EURY|nr:hypothetical protein SAMN04487950_4114 [Halogranum rubrum]